MLSRWLPVVVWAGVIFALSSIPSLSTHLGTWDLILRKAAHMAEYAILAVLLRRATGSTWWAFGLAVAYAATDEFHQTFVRGRHGTPVDVGIDAIGALLGLAVVRPGNYALRTPWSTEKSPIASSRPSSSASTGSRKSSRG
jgi:VanZ family protein